MTENQSLNMHLNIRCSSAESQFFQADVILTNHRFYSLTFDEMENVTKQRLRDCRNKTQNCLRQPRGVVGDC